MKNKFSKKLIALLVCGSLCAVPVINAFAAEEVGIGSELSSGAEPGQTDPVTEELANGPQTSDTENESTEPGTGAENKEQSGALGSGEPTPAENENMEETAPAGDREVTEDNGATNEPASEPASTPGNGIQGEVAPTSLDQDTPVTTSEAPITVTGTKKVGQTTLTVTVMITNENDITAINELANGKKATLDIQFTSTNAPGNKPYITPDLLKSYAISRDKMNVSGNGYRAFNYNLKVNNKDITLTEVPWVEFSLDKISQATDQYLYDVFSVPVDENGKQTEITTENVLEANLKGTEINSDYTIRTTLAENVAVIILPLQDVPTSGTGWEFDPQTGTITVNGTTGWHQTWYQYLKAKIKHLVVNGVSVTNATYVNGLPYLETATFNNIKQKLPSNLFKAPQALQEVTFDNVAFNSNVMGTGSFATDGEGKPIGKLTIKNCKEIPANAFQNVKNLAELTLENVTKISGTGTGAGKGAFSDNADLKTLTITSSGNGISKGMIDYWAFANCTALEKIDIDLSGYTTLQGFALDNAGNNNFQLILHNAENTDLGYSNIFERLDGDDYYYGTELYGIQPNTDAANLKEYLSARMEAIMDGKFILKNQEGKVVTPDTEGWTSAKTGGENDENTQLTKAAKWDDPDEKTIADVEFQFSYATKQGRDILFVVDTTKSMAQVASGYDDAKFYNLQSKLLDVSKELLGNSRYDNRVGLVTFASEDEANKTQFTDSPETIINAINGMTVTTTSTTDYSLMSYATELIKERGDKSREVEVIFISDGQPSPVIDYESQLRGLRAVCVDIYSVVQANGVVDSKTKDVMEHIASDPKLYYEAKNTEQFSEKMNQVLEDLFTRHTLTDVIDPDFALRDANDDGVVDESDITISGPEGTKPGHVEITTDENGNTVLTWTITGVPYQLYTMDYKLDLKQKADGTYPTKTLFDTNEGDAVVKAWIPKNNGEELTPDDLTEVNRVETPQLPRRVDLEIEKELRNFNPSLGEATFIFEISGRMNGIEVYNNVAGISFDESGTNYAYVKDIPLCDELVIREVYSGNYTVVGNDSRSYDSAELITQSAGPNNVLQVPAFVNTYNTPGGGLNHSAGVINNYTGGAGNYQVSPE